METTIPYMAGLILIFAIAAVAKLRLVALLFGFVASLWCFVIILGKGSDAEAAVTFGFIFVLFCISTVLELREYA